MTPNASDAVSVNPATGEELGRYPALAEHQQAVMLDAAAAAFATWRSTRPDERSAALLSLGDCLLAERQQLARRITTEMGKPITQALAEVDKCVWLCRWYADNLERLLADEAVDLEGDDRAVVRYLPLGVVLAIMPWNFPLWQVLRAAVPIISAGNGFVLKHADNVQGSALALLACFDQAGFPKGLFSVLHVERDDIARLVADPHIVGVTVTAGVSAGATLAAEAGRNVKKSLLELGGADPFIVLADADLDRAVPAAVEARFQNCGQVCIAAKRLIVEKPVAEEFISRLLAAVDGLRMGDPLDPDTQIGPMARPRGRSELHDQVERSVAMGARILRGGELPVTDGVFYPPTVLVDVTSDMPVCREETFGPVAAILVAEDAAAAIRLANDSRFGLSASLWSSDHATAAALAAEIETGAVFINRISASDPRVPIGGIKHSGYGRELSHFGLREFSNVQLCWLRD